MGFALCNVVILLTLCTVTFAAVTLTSVNHVQAGPEPMSYVYLLGQNMSFECDSSRTVTWTVEIITQTPSGALALASNNERIETGVSGNNDLPSNITILNAGAGDSNTTVTCLESDTMTIRDSITIFVEGPPPCPVVTATSITDSTISLSWEVPTTLLEVTHYQFIVVPAVDGVNGTVNVTDTTFTLSGLQPSTQYNVGVAACSVAGCSQGCGDAFSTGPYWADSVVSVCTGAGTNPVITVIVQYMDNGQNNTASNYEVTFEGLSYSANDSLGSDGYFQTTFTSTNFAKSFAYAVRVQPFYMGRGGNTIRRTFNMLEQVVFVTRNNTNYTVSCEDTCTGTVSVASCSVDLTCFESSESLTETTDVIDVPGNSTSEELIAGQNCRTCSTATVVSLSAGSLSFNESVADGVVIGQNCDSSGASSFFHPSTVLLAVVAAFHLKFYIWF